MDEKIMALVALALGVPRDAISLESSSGTVSAWDSLGHIAILDALDVEFPGITSRQPGLGSAESVSEILALVQADS
jgi:hypothetical protein